MALEEVPPGSDHRTMAWLRELRDKVEILSKVLGEGEGGIGTIDTPALAVFNPVYESSRTVLAGTGESEATEDAFTTVSAGAPAGARCQRRLDHARCANTPAIAAITPTRTWDASSSIVRASSGSRMTMPGA